MKKLHIGMLHADYITMDEAIEYILGLSKSRHGGYVVTPNVDHVVVAEHNEELRTAYDEAALSLADGMPLVWLSKLLGCPLPEKVSGSDLVRPLLVRAAKAGLKVYFLGSAPGVGLKAATILEHEIPELDIVGVDSPPLGFEKSEAEEQRVQEKMLKADPEIVLVALGAPKQEFLMHRWYQEGIAQIMIGIGASIDFIAGEVARAPRWMSCAGMEWLYRLAQDPKRLARRYLVQDSGFIPILYRMMRTPRDNLVYYT